MDLFSSMRKNQKLKTPPFFPALISNRDRECIPKSNINNLWVICIVTLPLKLYTEWRGGVEFLSSSYLKLIIHEKIWSPMANITNNEISRI